MANEAIGMERTVRIGIVGTGTISRAHARGLEACENVELAACCDIVPEAVARFAEEQKIETTFTDVNELVKMDGLDAVIISTPPFAHKEPVIAALESGKHVLCEKPFAMNAAEAEAMAAVSRKTGKYLAVCCSRNRFTPVAGVTREVIGSGVLGDVYHAKLVFLRRRGRPGFDILEDSKWFLDFNRAGGGVIADLGHYHLDLMLDYLGWPDVLSVAANVTHNRIEPHVPSEIKNDVEEHVDAYIRLAGGLTLSWEVSWITHMEGANGVWLYGTRGGLRVADGLVQFHDQNGRPVETHVPVPDRQRGGGGVTKGFVDALRAGEEPVTTADQGVVISKIVDAIYESSKTGAEVRIG
jgi:predicted dehydrogenase